jgi:hypothetical protein
VVLADDLLDAYRATVYRVRLPAGGCAPIRIGAPLPPSLTALLDPVEPWGFLTAWNPGSVPRARAANRAAQHALLAALRPLARLVRAGIGVGLDGWREPSLWVTGVPLPELHRLACERGQLAFVHGERVALLAQTRNGSS